MALIKCPECGGDLSDQAGSCPHCGRPMSGISTSTPTLPPYPTASDARRREALKRGLRDAAEAAARAGHKFAIQSEGDYDAVFTVTQPPSHMLHLLLTILLIGLWLLVWLYVVAKGGTVRAYMMSVDEAGELSTVQVGGKQ